jgi:hypothetical protein
LEHGRRPGYWGQGPDAPQDKIVRIRAALLEAVSRMAVRV